MTSSRRLALRLASGVCAMNSGGRSKSKSASVYIAIDQDVSTLPFSDRRLARRLDADERKEFPARRGIVAESAEHKTGNHLGSRFMHPSRTHTLMRGSENDSDSLGCSTPFNVSAIWTVIFS